ncbi:MAG TPA: cation:proton antiporter [bacterium]|nr:cation:proton antiporter [bacterium]
MTEPLFVRDLALVCVAALAGGALAQALRQPLFVGYLVAGLFISPFTPGPAVQDQRSFELFAQIGVVLLMFGIGIEFSLREITRRGAPAVLGAPATMVLTVGLAAAVGALLRWPPAQAVAVGVVISVASTTVVAKLLTERGEVQAPHARLAVATLLAEDIAVVGLIVLLPTLGDSTADRLRGLAGALLRAALVLGPFFYLANRLVPAALGRVARRRNTELFVLTAMAIGVGTAALSGALGLSLALGAFLGGLVIGESEFTHEILTRILPLRDVFGALFFVSMGTLIHPAALAGNLTLLAVFLALIIPGKFLLRLFVLRAFRYPWATAALVSVHLAQTGEFSFVLAQVARGAGLLGETAYQALLAASLISILITAVLSELAHRGIEEPVPHRASGLEQLGESSRRVLICGFGRVGGTIGEALEAFRIPYTVVDLDLEVVEALRQRGIPAVYGDAAGEPVLRAAGAAQAALAVVATPDFERTRLAVRRLRRLNPPMPILARATHPTQRRALREAGATEVIQPEFEAAQTLLRHGLERLGIPHEQVKAYMEQQRAAEFAADRGEPQLPFDGLLATRVVRIGPGFCVDCTLRRARIRERTGVSVLAVRRADGSAVVNPGPDVMLRLGDEVTVIGLPDQIALFERLNGETGDGHG